MFKFKCLPKWSFTIDCITLLVAFNVPPGLPISTQPLRWKYKLPSTGWRKSLRHCIKDSQLYSLFALDALLLSAISVSVCLALFVCLFVCLLAISYPLAGINFWHICLTNCFVFWTRRRHLVIDTEKDTGPTPQFPQSVVPSNQFSRAYVVSKININMYIWRGV